MQIEVDERHSAPTGILRDYCDGAFIKSHPLHQGQNTLYLAFYYDDLETANPLGSKRGTHKLG